MKIDSTNAINSLANAKQSSLITNLKNKIGKGVDNNDAALREQTDKFEALFIKTLLDSSLNMDNPLYPKQPGADIYNAMYKEQLSESLSGRFGYSELLFQYLKDQQKLNNQ
ncbi:hypothetical protein LS73_005760 [Helicobacter muridarum]|uniref:Flagellar rod assembly protein/muramidase FlgJ n=1 Tax=Helicobacter muridarum TaxID=216 RepID=A0A099U0B7_9HELI|nr:hypothetical protein [Helicobacter muridarum]TLE00036.1 hypothetical protein LS73_005760 [Helicobacter muridarum]STQ86118.1 flagellar rod assembly protein/muramidase FlgJ [Helicobacter muridarum]